DLHRERMARQRPGPTRRATLPDTSAVQFWTRGRLMPTRQIAWNVGEVAIAVMYALVAVQAALLFYSGTRRYLGWRRGRPYGPISNVGQRLRAALGVVFLHRRLIRPGYLYSGLMHLFIFYGFVVLFIGTLIVLLEADIARPLFGVSFYHGTFYVVYKLVIN